MNATRTIFVAALMAAASTAWAAEEGLYVDSNVVRQVQKTLNDRGYRTAADGRMGPRTQAAVRRFQRAENLDPTGQLNHSTLAALGLEKGEADRAELHYNRATIRRAQQTLDARGYQAGVANGELTNRTRAAIRQFQKSENLVASGRLNERTLAALGISDSSASTGSSQGRDLVPSDTVRNVQRELAKRGYSIGNADGVMGASTRDALAEFQKAQHLRVNGMPDKETLSALGIR